MMDVMTNSEYPMTSEQRATIGRLERNRAYPKVLQRSMRIGGYASYLIQYGSPDSGNLGWKAVLLPDGEISDVTEVAR